MKIKDVETQYPEFVTPEAGLVEAAQKMKRLDVGALPVCEGKHLVGVLTDRDITVRATAEGRDPRRTKVGDVMSLDPVCCYEDQDISECVDLMEQKQIRRLPMIDRSQNLVGIVSLGDLAIRGDDEPLATELC